MEDTKWQPAVNKSKAILSHRFLPAMLDESVLCRDPCRTHVDILLAIFSRRFLINCHFRLLHHQLLQPLNIKTRCGSCNLEHLRKCHMHTKLLVNMIHFLKSSCQYMASAFRVKQDSLHQALTLTMHNEYNKMYKHPMDCPSTL